MFPTDSMRALPYSLKSSGSVCFRPIKVRRSNAEDIESYREQIDSLQSENGRLSENINTLQQHIVEYTSKLDKARRDTEKFRSISEENLNLKQRERMLAEYVVSVNVCLPNML